jgi:aryl-alcohol dehydrogenase-like predicted oxidoreductase
LEIGAAGGRVTAAAAAAAVAGNRLGLSRICLGTMRLDSAGDADAAARILAHAFDIGITSLHCSSEYESFALLREAWTRARGAAPASLSVVAKIASPHFGEDRFSPQALRAKVDFYLGALGLERLGVVQWLLRHDLKQEDARLRILRESADALNATVEALKREGKIGAFVSFPYTAAVAAEALRMDQVDGLALYVNPLEHEMDFFLGEAERLDKPVIAIRPYAAGRLFTETRLGAADAIDYALGFPAVATAVVSASSRAHLDSLRPWLAPAG